jgi:glycosyltransferase involved in cell wall biosynthesis
MSNLAIALALLAAGSVYHSSARIAQNNGLSGLKSPPYRRQPRYRVSVVAPAYKEERYIAGLLRSAHNQTEPVAEVIVADSSPPGDGTAAICRGWGAVLVKAPAGNIALARNLGAAEATGHILVFADADVILGNQFVERAVDNLEAGAVLVHPREAIYDSGFWNLVLWAPQIVRPPSNTTRCVALWREAFDEVGGYDPECNPITGYCREDLDLGRRVMAQYGYKSIQVLGPLIATSARRYKKYGAGGWENFDDPVRAYVRRVI